MFDTFGIGVIDYLSTTISWPTFHERCDHSHPRFIELVTFHNRVFFEVFSEVFLQEEERV